MTKEKYEWKIRALRPDGSEWSAGGTAADWHDAFVELSSAACGEGMPRLHSVEARVVSVSRTNESVRDINDELLMLGCSSG